MDVRITLTGTTGLIQHNVRLADPMDDFTRAVKRLTDKKTKMTDEDREEKLHQEFLGSLYFHKDVGVYVPGANIAAALVEAARITRMGKLVEQGLFVETDENPLVYEGPRSAEGLWADVNFRHRALVRVQANRVLRCRPIFREWGVSATASLDPKVLSLDDLRAIAVVAGRRTGLGDYRPRFGRFSAVVEELS